MFDIITFGSGVLDIFLETGLRERGKFMVYPVGEKILLKNMKFDVGGGGTNTAVAFARFGFRTGYIGKVDSGLSGKKIIECLKKENIKFLGKVNKKLGENGGYSIILDSKERDRTVLTYKGINEKIGFSDIKMRKVKTKWIYLSSFLGKSFETQKELAKKLHADGTKIAFNPSYYLIERKNLKEILEITEVLILNKEEGRLLTKDKNLLSGLKKLGPKMVVVTNGEKMVYFYDGKRKISARPNKIKVVEKTGAGDAFASGFVAGQMVGKSVEESLKLGILESESVIKQFGAKNNLIRRKLK